MNRYIRKIRNTMGCWPQSALVLCSLLAVAQGPAAAQEPEVLRAEKVVDLSFDGPTPSWQVRPESHVRTRAQLRIQSPTTSQFDPTPVSVERISLSCPAGYSGRLEHPVDSLPIIDELEIQATIRSNRPGVQLAAEVVLPRSINPATNEPRRTLVYGTRYSAPGAWRELELLQATKLVARNARLLNVGEENRGKPIDYREAYVDRVVLMIPGGRQDSLIEIDRLAVHGVSRSTETASENNTIEGPRFDFASSEAEGPLLAAPTGADFLAANTQQQTPGSDQIDPPVKGNAQSKGVPPVSVRRRGATLTVEGVPLAPRIIEFRGESFDLLASLGFNTVWMNTVPTEAQLAAARKAQLWVICPPPTPKQLRSIAEQSVWQTVLAWSLGLDCTAIDLDQVASKAEATRQADPLRRVLAVEASAHKRQFAYLSDVLLTPNEIPLVRARQQRTPSDSVPTMGCSPWASIQAGWSDAATRQAAALAPRAKHLGWHKGREVRQLAIDALASGSRGLLIRTPARLGGSEPEAKRFADQLRLLNSELSLIEPWLVAGKRVAGGEVIGSDATTTAWRLGRSRLVHISAADTFDNRGTTQNASGVALLAVGVPETVVPHLLTPAGLLPLKAKRVAGGLKISLGAFAADGFVLLADDAQALAEAKQRVGKSSEQVAKAERQLAVAELLQLESLHSQLFDARAKQLTHQIAGLRVAVQQCDMRLASRDFPGVLHLARQLRSACAYYQHQLMSMHQQQVGFISIATQTHPQLLPTHEALEQALRALPRGPNLLSGGDLEGLAAVKSAGWNHASLSEASIDTAVEFTTDGAQQGQACLRIKAHDTNETQLENQLVVWVASPRVPAPDKSIVEISGWARVQTQPGSNAASSNGELVIVDSLGEEELALRIPATRGWQPFRMIRVVDGTQQIQLNFGLDGPAVADVDGVMVREVLRPRSTASATTPAAQRK